MQSSVRGFKFCGAEAGVACVTMAHENRECARVFLLYTTQKFDTTGVKAATWLKKNKL